jgi:hypothetical protein
LDFFTHSRQPLQKGILQRSGTGKEVTWDGMMEILETVLRWVVMPIGAFVWLIFMRQQDHATQIAVIKTGTDMARQSHDREIKEIKDKLDKILEKLDDKADK